MAHEATCGTGMAAQAALPARLADVTDALATVLIHHTEALSAADPAAAAEREAWLAVAREHQAAAARLRAAAERMVRCRDLPPAPHDMDTMAAPTAVEVFEEFTSAEHRLAELLRDATADNDRMLAMMRGPSA